MVNSFLAESVGSDGYAIKGPAAAALQAGAALIALAGDQIGFTSRPVMQMPAATPTPGQVLAWNGSSWEPTSISAGTPGGTSGQLQFNNGGVFDGVSGSYVSGSDVTLAGNLSLAANKQIEFGSVGIIKQSSNLLYLQSANGIRFRNMGDTAYTSAVGESLIGTDYIQGYTAVRVGQSSGGRLLPITDGVRIMNWAQTTDGALQAGAATFSGALTLSQGQWQWFNTGIGIQSPDANTMLFTTANTSNPRMAFHNSQQLTLGSGGSFGWTSPSSFYSAPTQDALLARNATGPAVQVQAAGGLNVRTLAGSADGPLTASTGTFSGNLTIGSSNQFIIGSRQTLVVDVNGDGTVGGGWNSVSVTKQFRIQSGGSIADGIGTGLPLRSDYGLSLRDMAGGTWAELVKNGTALNIQAAGGLNVKNLAGSAFTGVQAGKLQATSDGTYGLTVKPIAAGTNGVYFTNLNENTYLATLDGSGNFSTHAGTTTAIAGSVNTSYLSATNSTVTASTPALNVSQTWNNAAVAFTLASLNATATAAANGSKLLQIGTAGDIAEIAVQKVASAGNHTAAYMLMFGGAFSISYSLEHGKLAIRNAANTADGAIRGGGFQSTNYVSSEGYIQAGSHAEMGAASWRGSTRAFTCASTAGYHWSSTSNVGGSVLVGFNQVSGVVEVNSGTTGDYRDFKARAAVFSSTVTSAFQTLSADPTTTDISAGNQRMVKNSTSGTLKLWANDAGTMKSVALT